MYLKEGKNAELINDEIVCFKKLLDDNGITIKIFIEILDAWEAMDKTDIRMYPEGGY